MFQQCSSRLVIYFCFLATPFATACSSDDKKDDGGTASQSLEIIGTWHGDFGDETISATAWNSEKIVEFDDVKNTAVTQSPADDMFTPNEFNKKVWTEPASGAFFYCTVAFGLASKADAEASTATADDSDPANGGCGGMFPWTKLQKDPL